ncbi:unnamed protein product [Adineta ricciae]|uniref:Uncharacterized protein n=1 Tax=Adineta ricciae TaxID=249248 RepID=A0A813RJ79_ADIRI|nr:unnamed protein product [Adineta ricciae]CAF1245841.1 unnamed protein product [Adineta ricciae]
MEPDLSSESANWVLPSQPVTFTSVLPTYEDNLPHRVNREGIRNYIKSRGTLNIGDWAIEGRRPATPRVTNEANVQERNALEAPGPKVIGPDALRNYTRNRSSTPNLIYGNLQPPDPHHQLRVKREGRVNYEKNLSTQMKSLFHNYGKLPLLDQPVPHTQGELATNLFYSHQEGRVGPILNNSGGEERSPRPVPHVKGFAAENNLQKGYGDSQILEHKADYRPRTADPHVKGEQAQLNYDAGLGRHVDKLLNEYGKLPQSARAVPKVRYDGIDVLEKSQGGNMRKAISQCPPSNRYLERPVPVLP